MSKLIFIMAALLALAVPAMAEDINVRSIGYDDVVHAGEYTAYYVTVKNTGTTRLEDVQVRLDSPEMDIFAYSDQVDINRGDATSFVIPAYIPNAQEGLYILRFTVTDDDDARRTYYRYILIE